MLSDYIDKAAKSMTIILTALMIFVVGVNVFCRYLLGFSFGWGEELPRYCLVWIAFTGGTVAVKHYQMMAITFVVEKMPDPVQWPVRIFGMLSSCVFLAIASFYGVKLAASTYHQASPALRIPMSYVYMIMPLCCLAMLYHLGVQAAELVRRRRELSPDHFPADQLE